MKKQLILLGLVALMVATTTPMLQAVYSTAPKPINRVLRVCIANDIVNAGNWDTFFNFCEWSYVTKDNYKCYFKYDDQGTVTPFATAQYVKTGETAMAANTYDFQANGYYVTYNGNSDVKAALDLVVDPASPVHYRKPGLNASDIQKDSSLILTTANWPSGKLNYTCLLTLQQQLQPGSCYFYLLASPTKIPTGFCPATPSCVGGTTTP